MNNGGVLCADRTIKYVPQKSVLKHRLGDTIALDEAACSRLALAFLAEIKAQYV